MQEPKKPIGDFIIKNSKGTQTENGVYYHYTEVCRLLKLYEKQLLIHSVVSSLPTKEEMHLELSNRVKDIKETSSMGANKQMLLAYRIGFEECDDYMRKR